MKTNSIFSLLILAIASCWTAAAQENLAQAGNARHESQTFRKVQGCLAYNGTGYVLAVVSNGPKQYRVVGGDLEALRGKLGHTVEIDGMTARNNPQEMVMNWDQREATTGAGWFTIRADRVSDVTSNCSYPGFEHPPSHVDMN